MKNDESTNDSQKNNNGNIADVGKHAGSERGKGALGFAAVVIGALIVMYIFNSGGEEDAEKSKKEEVLGVKELGEDTKAKVENQTDNVNVNANLQDIEETLSGINVDVPSITAPPEITDVSVNLPEVNVPQAPTIPPLTSGVNNQQNNTEKAQQPEPAAPPIVMPPTGTSPQDPPAVGAGITPPTTIKDIRASGPTKVDKTRRANPMIAMGGGGGSSGDEKEKAKDKKNMNLTNDDIIPGRSSDQIDPTHLGDMRFVVAQGTIMDAILETAINTDLEGLLRAVVSRDVYAEVGYRVLIPKGARLIGEYETTISYTQSRVDVRWTRIILPNGLDFELEDADAVDALGRAGVRGEVRHKLGRQVGNALLVSSIQLFSGLILDKLIGDSNVTIETDGGSTTTTGSVMAQLAAEAVTDLTDQLTTIIERFADDQPTILVQQGTKIKIFVNNDMVFPSKLYK